MGRLRSPGLPLASAVWRNTAGQAKTVTVDPLGNGRITNRDAAGMVSDVLNHASYLNPDDAKTLAETTVRYDARGRPVARTVWLTPLGQIDPDNPPIAGEDGIPATDDLTTHYQYDENLTDGVGLDADFNQYVADLGFGAGSDGSATLVTSPASRRTLTIRDGLGRTVRTVQLAADGSALTQVTTTYDTVVNIAGYGDVLETATADALGHTTRRRTDGAGRTIETVDAENNITQFWYDADGNRLKFRDPNGVGEDCTYDARNRRTSCADTQEQAEGVQRGWVYDKHGNVLQQTDAKGNATVHVYDARDRKTSATDRLGGVTQFAYDANGNLLSLTDAENQTTSYEYDPAGRKIKETDPDHVAGTDPGHADSGVVEFSDEDADDTERFTAEEYGNIHSMTRGGYNKVITFNRNDADRLVGADSQPQRHGVHGKPDRATRA